MSEGKVERVWVCDLCGQRLGGPNDRCNSGLHQGPDDPNGWRGKATLRKPSSLTELRGAIEEHRQQGLRDSHEHGDALDYIDRAQENDKRLYAALTDSQEAGDG